MSTNGNVPVAPAMGAPGRSARGGHHYAYRAQPRFWPEHKALILSRVNPWRQAAPARPFWDAVLERNPAPPKQKSAQFWVQSPPAETTIQEILDIGTEFGFLERETQDHLRWLYTWGGSYIAIDNVMFPEQPRTPEEMIKLAEEAKSKPKRKRVKK